MYYVYDLLKDKIIYKAKEQEELLKALGMPFDQNGFFFEKVYKNKYVVTKNKPTKKRLTQEEKIKIVVSDFNLMKKDFVRVSKEELELIEHKITALKISKQHWEKYLKEAGYIEKKKTYLQHKIKELLETARISKTQLKNPQLKDLEKLDSMLEEFEIDTVAWYHYLEGIMEWTKKK